MSDPNVKLTQQTIELFEGALKNLKVERDRFLNFINDEEYYDEYEEYRKLASGKNAIFDRVKRQLDIDAKYLETIPPNNLKNFTRNEFLQKLRVFRAQAAVKLNHPDALEFVAEALEARGYFGELALSDELLEFSEQHELQIELREACANASRRVVEKTFNHYEMRNFAKWTAVLPANLTRLDAAIKLLEKGIENLKKEIKIEAQAAEEKGELPPRNFKKHTVELVEESLRELKRKREGM